MIPALIVPVLNRPDLLARMAASVDVPVERFLIIDNGGGIADAVAAGAWHLRMPANLGVAASWNLGIKLTADAPWWAIVNSDIAFGPGDLAMLARNVEAEPGALWTLCGFSAFGISREVVRRVGFFDENYHPAYCEDADYEARAAIAGVAVRELAGNVQHAGSSTIAEPRYNERNGRTYPRNVDHYQAKWGGGVRIPAHRSPFNRGGPVTDWTLDIDRLAELRW